MKFFVDTAKIEDIKKANDMGVICGVTTNPSLIAKEGGESWKKLSKEIAVNRRRTDQRRSKGDYSRCRGHDCRRT